MEKIQTNSVKAWVLAARPKTLTGAAVPVCIALSQAWVDRGATLLWWPALLCLGFAFLMQINANLINDYFDFAHGIDREDRLGPERACAQGWITPRAMKGGIALTIVLSALVGLPLVWWGGWEMVGVGAFCMVFSFLYTTLLSRRAMGDVLVLLFFGIVPVCATYFIQVGQVSLPTFLLSVGCGLATDNLLIVNNFRDRETDARHGKLTLVTLLGERASLCLYLLLAVVAAALAFYVLIDSGRPLWACALPLLYLLFVLRVWWMMKRIWRGRELNRVLGLTSLTILLYGLVLCAGILL